MSFFDAGGEAYDSAEKAFKTGFTDAVGALSLADLVVPSPEDAPQAGGLPIDSFRLVAITSSSRSHMASHRPIAYEGDIPNGVRVDYYEDLMGGRPALSNEPFIDGGGAIGLVGRFSEGRNTIDLLLAVAASGMYPNLGVAGEPKDKPVYGIGQLQALVRLDLQPIYTDALRNSGFRWANTLTRAHEEVAGRLGIGDMALLCDQWRDSPRAERIRKIFGGVAHAQGFKRQRGSTLARLVWAKTFTPAA